MMCTKQYIHDLQGKVVILTTLRYPLDQTYPLNQIIGVLQEKTYTKVLRKWGVPGNKDWKQGRCSELS